MRAERRSLRDEKGRYEIRVLKEPKKGDALGSFGVKMQAEILGERTEILGKPQSSIFFILLYFYGLFWNKNVDLRLTLIYNENVLFTHKNA